MSRAGTPTDNAAMESINGWIKSELFTAFHLQSENVIEEMAAYIKFFHLCGWNHDYAPKFSRFHNFG